MNNKLLSYLLIVMAACWWGGTGVAQVSQLEKPAANLTEKWTTNSDGWVGSSAQCGWTNGTIAIRCPVKTDAMTEQLVLRATNGASGDIFFGNYSNMESVSFDVQPFDMPVSPRFYFKSSVSGLKWYTSFLGSYVNGKQVNITIPLVYGTNWIGDPDASLFNNDKTNIYEVGFEFWRTANNTNAQQFAIDNLKLIGPWGGPYSNGVPLAWVIESGLTNDFGSAGTDDNDGDHFSNAAEFLAGTDPTNAASFFNVEIARNGSGGVVVRWRGNNRNVSYDLLESSNLTGANAFTVRTNIAPVTIKTEEVRVDQAQGGAKFFKVLIKEK